MSTRNNAQHEAKTKEWRQSRPTVRSLGSPSSYGKNPSTFGKKSTRRLDSDRNRRLPTEIQKAIELREGTIVQIVGSDGLKMRQEPRPWKEIEFLGLIQEINSIQITDFNGSLVLSEYNHEKWWKEDSILPGCVILAFDETPATPRSLTQSLAKKLEKTSSKGGEVFYDVLFWIPDEGRGIYDKITIPAKTHLEYVGVKGISAVFRKGKSLLYCDLDDVIKKDLFQLIRQGPERVVYEAPPPTPPPLTRTFRRLPSIHQGTMVTVEKNKKRKEKDHDNDNDAAKSSKHHRKNKKHHHYHENDDAEGEGEDDTHQDHPHYHGHHRRHKKKKKKHKKHRSHSRSGRSRSKSKSRSQKSRSKSTSRARDETGKGTRTRIRSKRSVKKKSAIPPDEGPMSAIAAAKAAKDRERNTALGLGAMQEARKIYLDSSQKNLVAGVEYVLNRSVTAEEEGIPEKKRKIPKDSHVVYVGAHDYEEKIIVVLIEIDGNGGRKLSQLKIAHIDNIGYTLRLALTKRALGMEIQAVAQRDIQSIVTELHKKVKKRSRVKKSHATIMNDNGEQNGRETEQRWLSRNTRQTSHDGRETQQEVLSPDNRPTHKSIKSSPGQEKKSVRIVVKKSRIKAK